MENIKSIISQMAPKQQQQSTQETLKISEKSNFDLAKAAFWARANKLAQKELKASFDIDEENKHQVTQFVAWFTGDVQTMQQYGIDHRKGIMLIGNPGGGKSMLFRIIKDCLNHQEFRKYFRYFKFDNCDHPGKMFMKDGDSGLDIFTKPFVNGMSGQQKPNEVCFDDLGSEEIKNNFGNKKEVMVDVILQRYEMMLQHGIVTHFTTNLTPDQIEARYSSRIRSRLAQMCNVITIGNSTTYTDRRR